MRLLCTVLAMGALAGCAPLTWQDSQDYVARQSDFNVCRLTMGGPHSQMAQHEAHNRALNCPQYYGAILQQQAQQDAAIQNYINSTKPPPAVHCTTTSSYNVANTTCR